MDLISTLISFWCSTSNQDTEKQERRLYVMNQDKQFRNKSIAIAGTDF